MRRSEINLIMRIARNFMQDKKFLLPPWAYWSMDDWNKNGQDINEIKENMLGWDITDFGSGDFGRRGLFLFTIRNGKFPVDLEEHIDDLLQWFRNNALGDTIFRVGHDRSHKLGPDDRNSDNKVKE